MNRSGLLFRRRGGTSRGLRHRRLRRMRPYLLACSVIFAAALWLTFQHKPGWYRPVEASEEVVRRARRDAPNLADAISDHLVRGEPIEVTLREHVVNEWLAALPEAWPEAHAAMPPELSRPAVRFTREGIRVGCHVSSAGLEVILGASVHVRLGQDRRTVAISLESVQAGSLPLPRPLIRSFLDRALRERNGNAAGAASEDEGVMPAMKSADDLFEGFEIDNRFEWPNGRRWFRIGRLINGEGTLTLILEPIRSTGRDRRNRH